MTTSNHTDPLMTTSYLAGRPRWAQEGRPPATEVVRRPPGRIRAAVDRPALRVFRDGTAES